MPARKIYLLYIGLLLLLVMITLNRSAFTENEELPAYPNIDTLVASLRSNQSDYYLFRGEPAGYHMELIRAYARSIKKPYRIRIEPDINKRWQDLLDGEVNLVVSSSEDDSVLHYKGHRLFKSLPLEKNTNSVWVVTRDNRHLLESINKWIAYYSTTPEYKIRQETYFVARINLPVKAHYASLSPYDHLIKHYAHEVNWDWRLLASLIYQESKFHPDAESYRGAYGLMQVTPRTAEFFKIENFESPHHNMEAGIKLIKYLQRKIPLDSVSSADSIRFVLAAYNAGLSRLRDCRQFATSQGKDAKVWKDVASVIPLMKHQVFYDSDDIQLGRFKGVETLNYVEQVMDRYENYKVLVEP